MSKVTSKFQISIPKAMADRFGVAPGDDLKWEAAGEVLRLLPAAQQSPDVSRSECLRLFDRATARQAERDVQRSPQGGLQADRGWERAELYDGP